MDINANEFSLFIESASASSRKSVLEVILEYCSENFIDVLEIIPYLNSMVISKLEECFIEEGSLPKRVSIEDLF